MINRSGPPLSSLEISSRAGHEFALKKKTSFSNLFVVCNLTRPLRDRQNTTQLVKLPSGTTHQNV